jgi:hypothetical protein
VNVSVSLGGIDYTPPYFTDNYSAMYNLSVRSNESFANDLNATDETALDSFFMNWTTPFNLTKGSGLLINTSPLSVQNYLINVSINDTSNNLNWTYVNVSISLGVGAIDTTLPYFTDNYSTMYNISVRSNESFSSDLNATDETAFDSFFMNWTTPFNLTKGSGILQNTSPLSVQNYLINVSINDTSNNVNWTYVNVSVSLGGVDTTPPTFTNLQNHTHEGNASFSYDMGATDNVAIEQFSLNQTTNFTVNSVNGIITNVTVLDEIYIYWLNLTVNDTSNNIAWGVFFINVTEEAAAVITRLSADDMYILYNYERSDVQGEDMLMNYGYEY